MLLKFLYHNLLIIHQGSIIGKVKATLYISLIGSPLAFIVDKITHWYSLNFGYVSFVIIAILFDHFLGTWVHAWIKRDFSMKKNIQGLFIKSAMILFVGVLVEGFKHILGKDNILTDYFSMISRLMVFVYPAGSALMNCAIITNGAFPPTSWIKKITRFNKDMRLEHFKEKNTDENETNTN
ncbi:hypothetical protein HX109_15340 [Galbibacter sp. BG1]|uniref:hypothetical protein n=1 Tax=Galbibacter sp. BG1 TaxID=1170699 RepID=UPI0015BB3281|nr:hypothetical protein [Galbibacter sp. BG1]QLE02873.1 hypothetical protein HX109_15340 [Galbibacter sp. BG1]